MAKALSPDATMYIYGLIDPRNGDYFYVGSTRNIEVRYDKHKNASRGMIIQAKNLSQILKEIYAENSKYPEIEVLETTTYKDHRWYESLWINKLQMQGYELVNAGAVWPSLDKSILSVIDAPFPEHAKDERIKALELALEHANKKIEFLSKLLSQ